MSGRSCRVGLALVLVVWASVAGSAQGTTPTSLRGVVRDAAGRVVPGAAVDVRGNAGVAPVRVVTDSNGAFSVPALWAGTYSVTVSLAGYATVVVKGVKLVADLPGRVTVKLERAGQAPPISTAASTTVVADQIEGAPYPTRNVLDAVTLLPGVDTTTVARRSTVAGLPQSALSMTLDGINIQDDYTKTSDGFFARVTPRQDAIGQVTLSQATPAADAAGRGAVRLQFVTRSGTDRYQGTLYEYYRDSHLNSNSWFNLASGLPKDRVRLNDYGASQGGPILPGHTNAFFFVNYDEARQSGNVERTRTLLQTSAQNGVFSYNAVVGGVTTVRTVNLLTLAQTSGFLATQDPTVLALLTAIRGTAGAGAVMSSADPLTSLYRLPSGVQRVEQQPTVRMDFNLAAGTRLSGTYARQNLKANPDTAGRGDAAFPGFPNHASEVAVRNLAQSTLHTSLGARVMNEVRVGGSWGPTSRGTDVTAAEFGNQGGFNLMLPLVTSATAAASSSRRDLSSWNIDESLTWFHGTQRFTFGGDFTRSTFRVTSQNLVPSVSFGLDSLDPANAMFTTGNFAGASSADLANARSLYAMLVGSVNGINSNVALNQATGQYDRLGASVARGRQDEGGAFIQYAWRPAATFTINAGVRWELQRPFEPLNNAFATATMADVCGVSGLGAGPAGRACNIFNPGTLTGASPKFTLLSAGQPAYRTDHNNIAQNVGLAWRPNAESGPFRALFGDPAQATFRLAYGVAFNRNGLSDFIDVYSANPGGMVAINRNAALGNLLSSGGALPLLLRNPALLGLPPACAGALVPPACTPASSSYPLAATNQSVNIFDPGLKVPFTRSYSVGFERSLGRDTTLDIRYVGTRNHREWVTENWNEQNPIESGFLDEYRLAQANLVSNLANGRGATFQYFGPGTGTAPLPLYLAFLTGKPTTAAGDSTVYTGPGWTNTTFLGRLSLVAPSPVDALNDLWSDAGRRANAVAAGLSANLIAMNPDIGANAANVTRSAGSTHYDSLQISARRRLSHGLTLSANYTYATRWASTLDSVRFAPYLARSLDVVPHAMKFDWTYEIPFGHGRRFGSAAGGFMDGLFGGWQWNGTSRVQSGRLLALSGVRLVGMNQQELQREFHVRIAADQTVTMLPSDVLLNTRRAFSTDPTSATGYGALGVPTGRYIAPASTADCIEIYAGDCGEAKHLYLTGPLVTRVDMSLRKNVAIGSRRSVQIEFDLLNAFNAIRFTPVLQAGSGAGLNQVTSSYQDTSSTFDPGGRVGQLVFRIKW